MRSLIILFASLTLLLSTAPALAAPTNGGGSGSGAPSCSQNPSLVSCGEVQNPNNQPNLNILNRIGLSLIDFILTIGAAIATIFIIIGGIRYIVSAGDPGQIASAKATLQYAIMGLVVIILAFAIVSIFVKSI